jgi:hypothetical protein
MSRVNEVLSRHFDVLLGWKARCGGGGISNEDVVLLPTIMLVIISPVMADSTSQSEKRCPGSILSRILPLKSTHSWHVCQTCAFSIFNRAVAPAAPTP